MNKALIMLSVSTFALLAASQVALAREPLKASTSTIGRSLLLDKPVLNLQKPNSPVANGTTNAVKTGQGGALTGVGVPGGVKDIGTGPKGPTASSILSSIGGGIKGAAGTVKGGVGQAKGVESKDTISSRMAPGMIGAIREAAATRGKEVGVQQGDGISAKMAPGMIKAIKDDNASKGKEKGVQSGDSSYRLTPGQLQQMKDMTINPKINPTIGMLGDDLKFDPKGDGKSGTGKKPAPMPAGPKPTGDAKPAPKPGGTATPKPATPKPGTGTAGTTKTPKPAGTGGKVAGVNPKTGTGTPAPKPKVLNGGKLIVFPATTITPKPKTGPLDKVFPKPKEPPKLEVIGSPAMDRLQ